jgi:hypothetical protein
VYYHSAYRITPFSLFLIFLFPHLLDSLIIMDGLTNLPCAVSVAAQIALCLGTTLRTVRDDVQALERWAVEFVPAAVCSFHSVCASSSLIIVRSPRIMLHVPLALT